MKSAAAADKTVVVVGSGGREHALAWKLSQSPSVKHLIVAPGNAGMPRSWERWAFNGKADKFGDLATRSREARVDLVVIGPDNPLADGLADVLAEAGVLAFGPSAAAARVEASKAFAKEVMQSAGIPTARHFVAHSADEAHRILKSVEWGAGWVIKADGLALGKGVRVCESLSEALDATTELVRLSGHLVIEERLSGEELSWMVLCDGERCALLEPARDYKRVGNGDRGPNTGGMGAFSPVAGVPALFAERVRREVFMPALRELGKRGAPFRGVLYAGLMTDFATGRYWVLEFNARFGDPETQVLMPRIEGDIYPWFEACARGDLSALPKTVPFKQDAAVFVVGAARGYPEQPLKGQRVLGIRALPEKTAAGIFTAGVAQASEGELVTSGGRVLGALGLGTTLEAARSEAYERLSTVSFEGMQFRTDIGAPTSSEDRS